MDTPWLIVVLVLGGLVMILGAAYAYIYFCKIKPKRRKPNTDNKRTTGSNSESDGGRKHAHPFIIMSYSKNRAGEADRA